MHSLAEYRSNTIKKCVNQGKALPTGEHRQNIEVLYLEIVITARARRYALSEHRVYDYIENEKNTWSDDFFK